MTLQPPKPDRTPYVKRVIPATPLVPLFDALEHAVELAEIAERSPSLCPVAHEAAFKFIEEHGNRLLATLRRSHEPA